MSTTEYGGYRHVSEIHDAAIRNFQPETHACYRPWFAWRPVRLASGGWAWLTTVIRYRVHCHVPTVEPSSWYEYDHPALFTITRKESTL